ncbi:hypothetical protein ABTC25_16885 [Acinetobacter baumannii]|uniref:hypothetical protein n=1 Tax=Acinetobacter baumannii TaxID=470 RepID=UPI000A39697C|nr:hypothetical protein [Acinetobacter baumannii]EHU1308224.1 hypothetical protein [Acinetobacter baumannii]EHU2441354.1 hypothetical protein [Acinetobacter baumannii]EJB5621274.1 hypothetical protein [Acinetobacter baumannii]ELB0340555.1 hypothetical protein [Acinetobacter baumannii]ELN4153566.1 hypothetical protein [Acinetobacter baumannii]
MFYPLGFVNKIVVYNFPIENNESFEFVSSYEILELIRLAEEDEIMQRKILNKYKNIDEYWLDEFRV